MLSSCQKLGFLDWRSLGCFLFTLESSSLLRWGNRCCLILIFWKETSRTDNTIGHNSPLTVRGQEHWTLQLLMMGIHDALIRDSLTVEFSFTFELLLLGCRLLVQTLISRANLRLGWLVLCKLWHTLLQLLLCFNLCLLSGLQMLLGRSHISFRRCLD